MNLETTIFWGNSLQQWLTAGIWVVGAGIVALIVYNIIERLLEPYLHRLGRLNQALSNLIQLAITIAILFFGLWQGLNALSASFLVLSLIEAFGPVIVGATILWFVLRLLRWATPDNFVNQILISQIMPIVGLIVALFWLGRFWVIRPLTCVPNCTGRNTINADLSNLNLSQTNLVEANLRGVDLSGTDLTGTDLSGANLSTAILRNANLTEATLIGADLSNADLRGAILEDTDFGGAILTQADLTKADLTHVNLSGATLTQAKLVEVRLTAVDLSGITLRGANLTGADLANSKLNGAYLSGANLSDAVLTNAELTGALLNTTNLTGANLRAANLAGGSFIGANLTSANLSQSKLVGATLIGTILKGTDLRAADLTGTRLLQSEILPSDTTIDTVLLELNDLQLTQIVIDASLNGVAFNQATVWPEGKSAFLSSLIGVSATISDVETPEEVVEAPEVVVPDFRIIGQAATAPLNQTIANRAAEQDIVVTFEGIDPTLTFGVLCTDETVAMAITNQPIREAEASACEASEQFPVEILIATEAYVLVAHPQNDFIKPLTLEQARKLLTGERWSDVDPRWPSELLNRYLPSVESAELALFTQWVSPEGEINLADSLNTQFNNDAVETISQLGEDPWGIAILGYGTYLQNSDSLRLIEIEEQTISAETIASGAYLFVHPLYLYVDRKNITDNGQVAAFLDIYLNNVSEVAEASGYFPIDPALMTKIRAAIAQAQAGDLLLGSQIIETAAITPDAPKPDNTPQLTVTEPVTTMVAVGDSAVTPPLLAAYGQFAPTNTGLSLLPQSVEAAFQQLCVMQTADLVMATAIANTEACAADSLIAVPAATDGVALVLNPTNSFAANLTTAELAALLSATMWSEVNPAWPPEPVTRLVTNPYLYQQLVSQLTEDDPNLRLSLTAAAVQSLEDVNQLVTTLTADPYSVGVVSFAEIRPFIAQGLQLATIDQQIISNETIADGSYPFAHSLFFYTTVQAIQNKPFVGTFLTTYLTDITQTSVTLGYAPPAAGLVQRAQVRLDELNNDSE